MKDYADTSESSVRTTDDTIAAIATASGFGGVGIIRISGPKAIEISRKISGLNTQPRQASYAKFTDEQDQVLDDGLVLTFPAPASYTGEDVVELQGHGSPVVLSALLNLVCNYGARQAEPGEFTRRAFLNDQLDLAQAEAVSDLIEASSLTAAKAAQRSLSGEFSRQVNDLVAELIELRVQIEAALDFPDEEIEVEFHDRVHSRYRELSAGLETLITQSQTGQQLRDGLVVTVLGAPNAGKSSLINRLSLTDLAIVTDVPGTTRDLLSIDIQLHGVPVTLVDTAGLRSTDDPVEQEGIRRALERSQQSDLTIWLIDESQSQAEKVNQDVQIDLRVLNKADLTHKPTGFVDDQTVRISAETGAGFDALIEILECKAGLNESTEGSFSARNRHINGLVEAKQQLQRSQLSYPDQAEIAAEELRQSQRSLDALTGEFHSDDLLGEIFSSFCIGK